MLLILLLLFVGLTILFTIVFATSKMCTNKETVGGIGDTVSVICLVIILILFFVAINKTAKIEKYDDKIAIYQEENDELEEQIEFAVELYKQHEEDMFGDLDVSELSGEKLLLLGSLYPELKSDTLVQAQIQNYIDNTNEIKRLKEEKIDCELWRWWLIFR